jgi:hypothetical protein
MRFVCARHNHSLRASPAVHLGRRRHPPTPSSSAASALAGQLSSLGAGSLLGGGASKSPADLYVGILKSRSVAEEMVKRFNLKAVYKEKRETAAEKPSRARVYSR